MANKSEDAGFLSRWSQRKAQVREGVVVAQAPPAAAVPIATAEPRAALPAQAPPVPAAAPETEAPPPPTLADVAQLTHEADYSRFVAQGVQPDVKNAALKKLFTDPHFNVMDGLDTYIDDYGKPDPLPEGMLRQMTQARFLGLFSDEEDNTRSHPPPQAIAPETATDEDLDLRLQPDDDVGRQGPEPGTGQDPGRQH